MLAVSARNFAAPTAKQRSGVKSRTSSRLSTSLRVAKNALLCCCALVGGDSRGMLFSLMVSSICRTFEFIVRAMDCCRHFHYIPEILASFFWCVPALFEHPLPYFYPVYLTLLLVDRAWRDDARCGDKYGKYWEDYCKKVPFKIIPGVV